MIQTISELIALVESGNDIRALRFEPKFVPDEAWVQTIIECSPIFISYSTARIVASSSWGKFQIMGENIYSLGFRDSVFEFWNDEEKQCLYFDKFLEANDIDYTLEQIVNNENLLNKFAKVYNGSQNYASILMNAYNASK